MILVFENFEGEIKRRDTVQMPMFRGPFQARTLVINRTWLAFIDLRNIDLKDTRENFVLAILEMQHKQRTETIELFLTVMAHDK